MAISIEVKPDLSRFRQAELSEVYAKILDDVLSRNMQAADTIAVIEAVLNNFTVLPR